MSIYSLPLAAFPTPFKHCGKEIRFDRPRTTHLSHPEPPLPPSNSIVIYSIESCDENRISPNKNLFFRFLAPHIPVSIRHTTNLV